MTTASTLVELLGERASRQPDQTAYTFLVDGEREAVSITYGELDRRARAIGAAVQEAGGAGERALLLYPPGLDFIAAFFGCLYGGAVAVPTHPPRRAGVNRASSRFRAIVEDAAPRLALTTASGLALRDGAAARLAGARRLRWLATDAVDSGSAEGWSDPGRDEEGLALLQYTSGSTTTPRGVVVSHGHILRNEAMIQRAFEQSESSKIVGWLPFQHDMGLIGNVFQPLYVGCEAVLMSPMAFLRRPVRWLRAISRYRGTTSGGPSFGYELCVRRVRPEHLAELDLSSWSLAFNGAEPVRQEVMEEFAKTFAVCGFRLEAFYPCYGLAEATLFVTGGRKGRPPVARTVAAEKLEHNRVVEAGRRQPGARVLVSSGRVQPEERIVIVDPETAVPCAEGQVGEIWLSASTVAEGYWNRPEETEITFRAHLAEGGEGPFLRTGDLGILDGGELFVTGRLKDLIIIRGKNHYPQDIEWSVQQSHPGVRWNASAAFSIDVDGEERLAVAAEVGGRHKRGSEPQRVAAAIRRQVADDHGLQVYGVMLLDSGKLPKTTSGKVKRHACRALFLEDGPAVLRSVLDEGDREWNDSEATVEAYLATDGEERRSYLESYLREQVAALVGVASAGVDVEQPLSALGLDSLMAMELSHRLEGTLGLSVSMTHFLEGLSIAGIARLAVEAEAAARPPAVRAGKRGEDHRLSHGQEALWYLQRLAPESTPYNVAAAATITGELDTAALRQALETLVERHPSLRTTFDAPDGKPVQRVGRRLEPDFEVVEAQGWTPELLEESLVREAYRSFDLESGPLLRVSVFARSAREHVALLAVHHIVADFWSLTVMMDELGRLYAAGQAGVSLELEPLELDYTDFVDWQAEMLASEAGEEHWRYWQQRLAGPLPQLDLPFDRPLPAVQTYRGASHAFELGAEQASRLEKLAREHGTTLYATLLAVFQVLLHRYSGQDDILVGSPTSGRGQAELAGLVGYFVNPVVLRADLSRDPGFAEFLDQVRQTVLGAFEHQDFPFPLLVERLQPVRDASRSPLFQVMFILQKAHRLGDQGLSALALGEAGAELDLWGLALESRSLGERMAPFDLTLKMARAADGLRASLEYNTDLFEEASIARMAGHFSSLVDAILADSRRPVSRLPMLQPEERRTLLEEWNDTGIDYPRQLTIQRLFEQQVEKTPRSVALVFEGAELSFEELNGRANQLARHLRSRGVEAGDLVGVFMERSAEMVVALLGVLKAGAAYLPLDPTYPEARTAFMLEDSGARMVLSQNRLVSSIPATGAQVFCLDSDWPLAASESRDNPGAELASDALAYAIYTSGSTGKPKGVMIGHRSVVNFFVAMDGRVGCDDTDTLLAVTSISFDISVLELLWTLTRGARVVLLSERAVSGTALETKRRHHAREVGLSLFYFANADAEGETDKYRLLLEGVRFADRHGFEAIWTPERHFHPFGGLYPSPVVTSAAAAAISERVQLRAGSVVMPLHDPIRVAEQWSLVDNISRGRVGVSFASGWHVDDFAFFPDNYSERKQLMYTGIETVQKLWRGESVTVRNGAGTPIEVRIHPRPVQEQLPTWITAAGNPDTFEKAGEIGANVLTHLLGQSLEDVAERIRIYRDSLARHGHDADRGRVTLMLHTFIGDSLDRVRDVVRAPLTDYLRTSVGLIANLAKELDPSFDLEKMTPAEMEDLLAFAFERYFETSGLFGTPEMGMEMIERVRDVGVDEVACLIDFGVEVGAVLGSLDSLDRLRDGCNGNGVEASGSFAAQAARYRPTLLQCTPSLMKMLAVDPEALGALGSLRALMLGGEALPAALAGQVKESLGARLINMYGPTETTIWSSTHEVESTEGGVPIGTPIANTRIYLLDRQGEPVPVGLTGELYIGGDGLAHGYLRRPGLTAERFVPDPFGPERGARLYCTGDLARWLPSGEIEFLGRGDQQTKIRGFRVEPEEIETLLARHEEVEEAVVVAREHQAGDVSLVAYVVPPPGSKPSVRELRSFLKSKLPDFMVPASFVTLESLPLTPNGKLDRKALPTAGRSRAAVETDYVAPSVGLERTIAEIWQGVLQLDKVGVNDNFFDLGGHSLLMAQVHSQLKSLLKRDLPLIKILEYPTISSLTRYLSDEHSEQRPRLGGAERASKQRAGLWRQSRSAMARRRPTAGG